MSDRAERRRAKRDLLKRQERVARVAARNPLTDTDASGTPDTLKGTFHDADTLAEIGPLVRVAWTVPHALADALEARRLPIPAPIFGHALVDTGAGHTAIALHVV